MGQGTPPDNGSVNGRNGLMGRTLQFPPQLRERPESGATSPLAAVAVKDQNPPDPAVRVGRR
jgi:hypothetical protein